MFQEEFRKRYTTIPLAIYKAHCAQSEGGAVSHRQEQPHSNMWLLYFCHKGVAGIVIPTQVVEQRRSSHWKTLKRDKGTWTK